MVDRRRQTRALSNTPQTELELLWEISERLGVVEADLADHIDEHKEEKKDRASAKALIWTNAFVILSVVSNILIHYLPTH